MMNEHITLSPELEARVHQAVENFMQGYGCCQSVVAAFADLYGLDDEMAKRIGAGFGGGVGRMRMMCGAVSGIVVLVGLDCGQTEGDDREGKSACYKVVQDLLAKSKEQNGSIICAEILGLKGHEKAQSKVKEKVKFSIINPFFQKRHRFESLPLPLIFLFKIKVVQLGQGSALMSLLPVSTLLGKPHRHVHTQTDLPALFGIIHLHFCRHFRHLPHMPQFSHQDLQ